MPQYSSLPLPPQPQLSSWKLDGGGAQVLDLETAVKDGILGGGDIHGGGISPCLLGVDDPKLQQEEEEVDLKRMIEELEEEQEHDDADDDSNDHGAYAVPSVFICPISLEAMSDPVTLCTGQTYDRANILRWFATGRLSCPTTMQDLWDDALVPNATLRRLIRAWFTRRRILARKLAQDVQGRARALIAALRTAKGGQSRTRALQDLQRLVSASPAASSAVAAAGGVALVSSLLGPFTSHAIGSEAVGVLANLPLPDAEARADLAQPAKVSLLVDILNEGTAETKLHCVRLFEMLLPPQSDTLATEELLSSLGLLVGLLRMARDKRHPSGVTAALRLLRTAAASSDKTKDALVGVGALPQLVELLPDLAAPEASESALHVLDLLSSGPGGYKARVALKECPQAIPSLVRLLMRVSEACTRRALSVLSALCDLAPEECAAAAVEAGLAAKLLLVIQSGCGSVLKQQAAELLKLCSLNYSDTRFISKCKLTRTIQ